jgi:hypothetical protein
VTLCESTQNVSQAHESEFLEFPSMIGASDIRACCNHIVYDHNDSHV